VAAFVLFSILEYRDEKALREYRQIAAPSIAKFGGRFLIRAGLIEPLEGDAKAGIVIVEFPDLTTAKGWYSSADYAPALRVSDAAFVREVTLFEGIE
jgi:uncharacterized protein (DUF1330 family)